MIEWLLVVTSISFVTVPFPTETTIKVIPDKHMCQRVASAIMLADKEKQPWQGTTTASCVQYGHQTPEKKNSNL